MAYSEIAYDGYQPSSIFELEGAKDVAIEFHSLSKTFNMTGWRLGFAAGNAEVLAGLGHLAHEERPDTVAALIRDFAEQPDAE